MTKDKVIKAAAGLRARTLSLSGSYRIVSLLTLLSLITFLTIQHFLLVKKCNNENGNLSASASAEFGFGSWRFGLTNVNVTRKLRKVHARDHNRNQGLQFHFRPDPDKLLNITDFKYRINAPNACPPRHQQHLNINLNRTKLLIVVIPSHRSYFQSRELIRSTWGSVHAYKNWSISHAFLLGEGVPGENSTIRERTELEARTHSDIVLGSFQDAYRNMTYKHLMGYKWILEYCGHADFVLKCDDDVMVDIYAVINDIDKIRSPGRKKSRWDNKYYCAMVAGVRPIRDPESIAHKWRVSVEEYPHEVYPHYCGFAAYLTTVKVIRQIYATAGVVDEFFWIDDVFVTGILRKEHNRQIRENSSTSASRTDIGTISIVNTLGRYNWSWEMSNTTYKQWASHLCFVVVSREYENGIMNAYWEQIKKLHFIS